MTPVLVITPRDNVATALEALEAGRAILLDGQPLAVVEPIPRGHKIALRAIAEGEPVIEDGSPIGTASVAIAAGTHVHTHNLASARGRGDLHRPHSETARIAEPVDPEDSLDVERTRA